MKALLEGETSKETVAIVFDAVCQTGKDLSVSQFREVYSTMNRDRKSVWLQIRAEMSERSSLNEGRSIGVRSAFSSNKTKQDSETPAADDLPDTHGEVADHHQNQLTIGVAL